MAVDPTALGTVGTQIGKGAQATVHLLPDLRLADRPGELVYKRYRFPTLVTDGVPDLIRFRNGMTPAARAWLDQLTLWPIRAVVDGDRVLGVVLPRIDDGFMHDVTVDGDGNRERLPREAQWLMTAPQRVQLFTSSPSADTTDRIGVCRDLAEALRVLHLSGIVFGDVSAKNALWRLDRVPNLQMLDCDAALSAATRTEVKQLNTPDWTPPEGGRLNRATDRYKLGLFVLRVLAPGRGQTGSRDAERARPVLGDTGTAMLAAAIGPDPSGRPTAAEWFRLLASRTPVAPPTIRSVRLSEDVVVRGRPVVVHWEATEASEVEVMVLDGPGRAVPGTGTPSVTVSPLRSGPIRVVARNRFGEVVRDTEPVVVLDPPVVPAPAVPGPLSGGAFGYPTPAFDAPGLESAPGAVVPGPLPAGVTPDPTRLPLPAPLLPAPAAVSGPDLLPAPPALVGPGTAGGDPR